MGDQNTSDLATTYHVNLLSQAGLFPRHRVMTYKGPLPRSRLWLGVYIDDWLAVLFARLSCLRLPDVDTDLDRQTSKRYLQAGLAEETSKAFHQDLEFKAWGALVAK